MQLGVKADVAVSRSEPAIAVIHGKKVIVPSDVTVGKLELEALIEATFREGL